MTRMKTAAALLLLLAVAPSLLAAEEIGKTFETNGVTIWYEVRGAGTATPLIIVNGGPGFDHGYTHLGDPAWDTMARTRRVIWYDQRGTGRSSELKPGQSCNLADQISDLDALRSELKLDKFILLGHSWGGYLVMAYTARHPERVEKLLIVDSAAPKIGDTKFMFNDFFPDTIEKQDAFTFGDEMGDKNATSEGMKLYLSMLFYSPEKRDAAMPRLVVSDYRKSVNQSIWGDLQRFDLNPELAKFRMPVLVATGRYDINVAPSVAWKIHKAIPGSRFVIFEKSGHIPYYEEPEAFAKMLASFL